ncbi:E3 ubiquitin-protein ligase RBBP6 isoform X2 [Boleophthalmus pectinirostris]|uniref:E3 ubiquitin-protein ligase RBBP6 isoform X2 n=1 Tax=Boleophthalmus pectinirostris TaxID=150288 RepID=UPI00242F6FDA|nr:E3 ubiquitin-protein ligase RBBP6 isoform X2 [Boleophthalmus pectinirostris]
MTHVHYKFSSKLSYNTVVFDGVNITLSELKRLIMSREKLRAADCDLQIANAQTKEEYTEDDSPIPKGASVIVRRVPSRPVKSSSSASNSQRPEASNSSYGFFRSPMEGQKASGVLPFFSKMANIACTDDSEDDKIKTMMSQSFYDSSNYKYGAPLPANYICYRCGSSEHHIRNCPVSLDKNVEPAMKIKKSTGIPRSFMVQVDDPSIKGAMLTNTGHYAIPAIDAEFYAADKKKPPTQESPAEDPSDSVIPDELLCLICKDLLNDAVVIPCCGNSYCDDCIRSALLDSEDHVCPTCNQPDVSPDTLIANRFLRQAVNNYTKEQVSTQSLKNTCSTSRSQDCTPRPSPAPTPPPQSQPDKSQVADLQTITSTDSPPSSSSTSLVVKTSDETSHKEADLKTDSSPIASPSVLVSEADTCDSLSQSIPLVTSVTQAVTDETNSGSTTQSEQGPPHWDRSTSTCPSEDWTAISSAYPASTSPSFPLTQSPNITPAHVQTYLPVQQLPLNTYPPGFTTATPLWTTGPSPQGAPIPTFTSTSIPPLLPKELLLSHRRNKERTPSRGSLYKPSYRYSSKSHRSKCSRSSSRSPSQSRSHRSARPYSPQSHHRGLSSRSHSSHSHTRHSYKHSHSPTSTSPSRSRSPHRSRSPADHHKSRHHGRHRTDTSPHSSRNSSRRSKGRESSHRSKEAPEWSLDMYLRWKQEYKDWCEKYFNSYFSHFHQMPPPPLMPPPQPHWPPNSPQHHRGRSPPSSDSLTSQSQSERSSSNSHSHSSSSYSDSHSTPTQSFSDSNSPLSDNCSRASQEPLNASHHKDKDENQNKVRESKKQNTDDCLKSPPKKTDKHLKSKGEDKRTEKDQKVLDKEKDRRRREGKRQDGSRQSGRSRSPDSRSDKSRKQKTEETSKNQRQNILIQPSSSLDLFPKVLEREKPKKATWKPQPLTAENAWEGGVNVKVQQKININIKLDSKKDEEAKKVEGQVKENTFYKLIEEADNKAENEAEEQVFPAEEIKDERNNSWEIFPEDEAAGEEDSDLWHCALTSVEEEERREKEEEEYRKSQDQEDLLDSERKHDLGQPVTKDHGSLTVGPSGGVIISEEQQKTVAKCLEKYMGYTSVEKHVKVTHSRREKDGSEKELEANVSSDLREVKKRRKHRRKRKRRTESEGRKGEEHGHHKDRETTGTFYSKSSNGSSQAFTSILDDKKSSNYREPGENKSREGPSRKIYIDQDKVWRGNRDKSSSSRSYHHSSQQDPKVHHNSTTLHSQSHSRDKGQISPKTSSESNSGQNWTCTSQRPTTPTAQSSLSTEKKSEGGSNERIEERERHKYSETAFYSANEYDHTKSERRKHEKKHKKYKGHDSPDDEMKLKKRRSKGEEL